MKKEKLNLNGKLIFKMNMSKEESGLATTYLVKKRQVLSEQVS